MIDFADEFLKISNMIGTDIQQLCHKKFLVTGANGLIGSYLALYLQSIGAEVYALSRSLEKLHKCFGESSGIKFIEQDLNLPFHSGIKFDYIIHAASNAHPLAFSTDPVGTMKTNLVGTMNLLECAKAANCKFLYLSTGEIYGNNIDHAFAEDDFGTVDTKLPRSCYPESKRAAETLCMAYSQQYGVYTNIARLCYVYGPTITDTNSRADAQFLRNALNNKDIVLKSNGDQRRTYCYVADAVSALLLIILKAASAEVYNVADKNSIVSVAEYAKTLADIAGVNLKFEIPDDIEVKGYSKQADSILDASKLENLGWLPQFSLSEGLEHTLQIKREVLGGK